MQTDYYEQEEKFKAEFPETYEEIDLRLTGYCLGADSARENNENETANLIDQKYEKLRLELNFLLLKIYGS